MRGPPDDDPLHDGDGAARGARRVPGARALRQAVGVLLALALAWVIFRAYRQPDFLIGFVNLRLC